MRSSLFLLAATAAVVGAATLPARAEVNLYTTREPGLIKPLLEAFTTATGVKVNTVIVDKGLAERVGAEGDRSPADVLMTVDIGNLVDLVDKRPDPADALRDPGERRAGSTCAIPNGHWFALSMRGRVALRRSQRSPDLSGRDV